MLMALGGKCTGFYRKKALTFHAMQCWTGTPTDQRVKVIITLVIILKICVCDAACFRVKFSTIHLTMLVVVPHSVYINTLCIAKYCDILTLWHQSVTWWRVRTMWKWTGKCFINLLWRSPSPLRTTMSTSITQPRLVGAASVSLERYSTDNF